MSQKPKLEMRWQEMRAEILLRDHFTCICGSYPNDLYRVELFVLNRNRSPFCEIPDTEAIPSDLYTVCNHCLDARKEGLFDL